MRNTCFLPGLFINGCRSCKHTKIFFPACSFVFFSHRWFGIIFKKQNKYVVAALWNISISLSTFKSRLPGGLVKLLFMVLLIFEIYNVVCWPWISNTCTILIPNPLLMVVRCAVLWTWLIISITCINYVPFHASHLIELLTKLGGEIYWLESIIDLEPRSSSLSHSQEIQEWREIQTSLCSITNCIISLPIVPLAMFLPVWLKLTIHYLCH